MQSESFSGSFDDKKKYFMRKLGQGVSKNEDSESTPDSKDEVILESESSVKDKESSAEIIRSRVKEIFKRFKEYIYSFNSSDTDPVARLMPSYYRDESGEIKVKLSRTFEDLSKDKIQIPDRYTLDSFLAQSIDLNNGNVSFISYQERTLQIQKVEESSDGIDSFAFCKEYFDQKTASFYGFPAPQTEITYNGQYLVSRFIDGKELSEIPNDTLEFEYVKQELKKRYILDLFLGNIDENTLDLSSYKLGTDGKVYRIGKTKEYSPSKTSLNIERILENRKGHPIYGDLTDLEIYEQINAIKFQFSELYYYLNDMRLGSDISVKSNFDSILNTLSGRVEALTIYNLNLSRNSPEVQDSYLSSITREYLKSLDEIDIEGNPELKETIRANIIESEIRRANEFEQEALSRGITVEELKRQLQENITQAIERSSFYRACDWTALFGVLNSGRFKSQFETGTSGGYLSTSDRSDVEFKMFGFPKFTNSLDPLVSKRPIYGYLSDNPEGSVGDPYGVNCLSPYGSITVKFKDWVKNRTTILFNDSFNQPDPPTPAIAPHFTSLHHIHLTGPISTSKNDTFGTTYTEAQYHNQLLAIDIEEIIISNEGLGTIGKGDVDFGKRVLETTVADFNDQNPENIIKIRYI